MKYRMPTDDEARELLSDQEFSAYTNDERGAIRAGRRKAWEIHRKTGALGQLRNLTDGAVGDSVLFPQYRRSAQLSALTKQAADENGAQLSSRVERSLVDGSIIGVRVTLTGFTR